MSYVTNKIVLVTSELYGSHFIAKQDILSGELLITEKPLVVVRGRDWDATLYNIMSTASIKNKMKLLYPRNITDINTITFSDHPSNRACDMLKDISDNYSEIFLYFNKLIKNCFHISLANICLYYQISFFNHSCCPNVVVQPDLFTCESSCYAITDIKKGEQLYINYLPGKSTINDDLKKTWGFTCKCIKCLEEIKPHTSIKTTILIGLLIAFLLILCWYNGLTIFDS